MILILSFSVALILTPLVGGWAKKMGVLDQPNTRKIHGTPIPLLGGVSIFLAFLLTLFIYLPINNNLLKFFMINLIVLLTGIYDDIANLKYTWKLLIEVVVAVLLIGFGIKISIGVHITHHCTLIPLIDGIITILWVVSVVNAINFIDGLDGLSASIVLWASMGFAFVGGVENSPLIRTMSLALGGAALGFLPFNLHPAKIFMGDAGSTFLGFILSILSILISQRLKHPLALSIPIIILAIPLLDMGFVILRRLTKRQSPFKAGKDHIHHRIMAQGLGQWKTWALINVLAGSITFLGMTLYVLKAYRLATFLLGLFITFIILRSLQVSQKGEK